MACEMEAEDRRELARRILELRAGGREPLAPEAFACPVEDYTSPQVLAAERQRLFRDGPLLAALSCDLPEAGAFLTLDAAGVPILLARQQGGGVRAFLNVCRHRGAPVADGRGRAPGRFTCPYHGWSYRCSGELLAWTHAGGFDGLDPAERGLTPLPVAEGFGLIYVRPTPGPPVELEAALGGIERELGPFRLGAHHVFEVREEVRALNWKLVVDTFMEQYHLPFLHRESLAPLFEGTLSVYDAFGRNGRLAAVRRSIAALDAAPETAWDAVPHTTLLYFLFPNAVLIHQQDHVELWQVYPSGDSPDEAAFRVTLYAPEPPGSEKAERHWKRNMDLLMDVTGGEDFTLGEKIQRGFRSGAQRAVTFGRNEPALIHYHRTLRAELGLPGR